MNALSTLSLLVFLAAILYYKSIDGWSLVVCLVIAWALLNKKFLYLMYHTLGRDLR